MPEQEGNKFKAWMASPPHPRPIPGSPAGPGAELGMQDAPGYVNTTVTLQIVVRHSDPPQVVEVVQRSLVWCNCAVSGMVPVGYDDPGCLAATNTLAGQLVPECPVCAPVRYGPGNLGLP
jgi:hypothetical protein